MEYEDDDLSAMRSALLASMPSKPLEKPTSNEEEDLSALRLAALMTRRQNQNQIQVIQQRPMTLPPPQPLAPPFLNTFHRMMPPPPRLNMINLTSTQNLISLTPGPEPNVMSVIDPSIVSLAIPGIRPLQQFPGVGRPFRHFQRPMRPLMRSMRPHMRSMRPQMRSMRPIRHNQGMSVRAIQPNKPISRLSTPSAPVQPTAAEVKVSDKFSRYNSDSSSDEDDLHTTDKRKTTSDNDDEDDSDAESVASEKSFSSVSDVAKSDTEVEKTNDAEDQPSTNQDGPSEKDTDSDQEDGAVSERNESDDNISIIDGEEDDILAAIDDYLEDRPEKSKSKKVAEVEMIKPVEKKTRVEKVEELPTPNSTKPVKRRKSSSSSSKASVVEKLPMKAQQTPLTSQKAVIKKPAKSSTNNGTKITKSTPPPKSKAKTSFSGKVAPGEKHINVENIKVSSKRDQPSSRYPQAKQPSEDSVVYEVPVVVKQVAPSPNRQRRDSDLDSVGTSDLSFISSESEDENIVKKPVSKTQVTSGDFNREDVQSKKRSMLQVIKEKTTTVSSVRNRQQTQAPQQPTKTFSNPDLRKKLEKRGLKKETNVSAVIPNSMEKIKSNEPLRTLSPVIKTGVISLKRKSRGDTKKEERSKSRSSSIESLPRISLPEPEEARRIIITRPNTSAASGRKSPEMLRQSNSSKIRIKKAVSHPKKSTLVKTTADNKSVKRKDNKDKSRVEVIKTRKPQRKKSDILPPKSEKRLKITQEKTLYKKAVPKHMERPKSSDDESSTSEDSDSSVSEESDPEVLEEVFAFNEAEIPEFDDVLGKVDDDSDHSEGEYIYKERKITKNSQTKSKKRKRTEVSRSRKMMPDSRRIVPKTDSPHSDSEDSEPAVRKSMKKSVHQRLGIARRENVLESQPVRERDVLERDFSRPTDSENDSEESMPTARRKGSVVSSAIRTQSKQRPVLDDSNNETQRRDYVEKEKQDSKRRKRKILVSGKGTKPSSVQSKTTKRVSSVKERLGKVVLSSVSIRNHDAETQYAEEPRYEPRRKKDVGGVAVKRRKENFEKKSKSGVKSNRKDGYLEARIKRIQQQNGAILRRQREIEMEKERYGF